MAKRFLGMFLLLFSILSNPIQATHILALGDGGIRGVASIEMLIHLQQATGLNLNQAIDVYAGTSTGSIIAVLLSAGMELKPLLEAYKEMSKNVFSSPHDPYLFQPKYTSDVLIKDLLKLLKSLGYNEDASLGDLPKKIVIPTTSLYDSKKQRWTVEIFENFTKEGQQVKIIDAIMRSASAPIFFPSYGIYVDGGIGMKDPSLAAVCYTHDFENISLEKVKILSIGTGYTKQGIEHNVSWGKAEWTPKLLNMVMDVSHQVPEMLNQKFMVDCFIKIDFPLSQSISLDDYKQIDLLIKMTDDFIANHPFIWESWCQWVETYLIEASMRNVG